jgi:hypothetical protein
MLAGLDVVKSRWSLAGAQASGSGTDADLEAGEAWFDQMLLNLESAGQRYEQEP